jgi:Holliday junction resolvasome RuvABC ATP-dependent DNA helicase subunit
MADEKFMALVRRVMDGRPNGIMKVVGQVRDKNRVENAYASFFNLQSFIKKMTRGQRIMVDALLNSETPEEAQERRNNMINAGFGQELEVVQNLIKELIV